MYKFTANRIDSRVRGIKQASMNMFMYMYDKTKNYKKERKSVMSLVIQIGFKGFPKGNG